MWTQREASQTKRHLRGHTLASAKDSWFCFVTVVGSSLGLPVASGWWHVFLVWKSRPQSLVQHWETPIKFWLYCLVNRADTLYQYWCYSTLKKKKNHANPFLAYAQHKQLYTNIGSWINSIAVTPTFFPGHWATDSLSLQRTPPHQNTLHDSILDFCTIKKKIHTHRGEGNRNQGQEGRQKWNKTPSLKPIILGLNTSIWLFQIRNRSRLYMIQIVWHRLLSMF